MDTDILISIYKNINTMRYFNLSHSHMYLLLLKKYPSDTIDYVMYNLFDYEHRT